MLPLCLGRRAAVRCGVLSTTALLTPALAQPTVFDTFDTGLNGWSLYADGENLAWSPFAGNPGGGIRGNDQGLGGYWGFSAPPAYLGDRSCDYGGLLRWQFNTTNSGSAVNSQPDATLEGAGLVLVINLANPVVDTWETRSVPLLETAGWRIATLSGAVPTESQFKSVLADLTAIKLRGEFSVAANDSCTLDNVAFGSFIIPAQPESTSTCPASIVSLSSTAQGVGPFSYQWQYESAPNTWVNVPVGPIPYAFSTISAANPGTDTLTLTLNTTGGASPLRLRCVVTNPCGSAPSNALNVVPCAADLNCDGIVDDTDFIFFVPAYDILDCADPAMPAGCPSDFNNDGVVDDADFSIFVAAYNALGCL